ncbi:hypothetical protein [Flavobacterium aquicola]|uniref:Uncharacterized protein n=1 Tax=Flavobacterium aquicola TaxID=1682742 RepID=A0A3E0EJP3_9FLAO|nr:hypothetical protein [Flavobacterium aquicola]REG97963.1 hypothetical protein C8P67_108128 [Flavobacterium aquicola]
MESTSKLSPDTKKRNSVSETGHAKNVANFQSLIAFVTAYGATYNPSKNALKLPQLTALATAVQASLGDVVTKNTAFNNKVNERAVAFKNLKTLATRLVNALQITDASSQKVDDAKGFNKKLQGTKSKKAETPIDPNAEVPKTISTSQLSYDQQIQHLAGLISVLKSETTYLPNEADLKVASLTTKQTDLTAKNNAVATAYAAISNSRIARNAILYKEETGLLDIAADVKKYIKSIYGAASPQFAQVSGLKFVKSLK